MHRLPSMILLGLWLGCLSVQAQSPHGEELNLDCALCHNAEGWSVALDEVTFDHSSTSFELEGTHARTDCKLCHNSLIFDEAPLDCASCHTDVHSMLVGNDCARCHDSEDWLVDNIPELHEENGFPLIGAHANLSCVECHQAETNLRFDRLGNECINCHQDDYAATTNPNHTQAGYSTDCIECHNPLSFGWDTENILHDFFPLTLGHDIRDCAQCHTTGNFADATPDCIACHQDDFQAAANPNHQQLNFDNDCVVCHTTDPDWMPAEFREHDDLFFPIYSGEHQGEWSECQDCHQNPNNYAEFTCTTCHGPDTEDEHDGVAGFVYESLACLACHPTGSEDGAFDHNQTNFPLVGQHVGVSCTECHANGFVGTPTDCFACHEADYQTASNPNHLSNLFPTDCAACHSENGWEPADFDHDGMYFPIYSGKHEGKWDDCSECHQDPGNFAAFTCITCHREGPTNDNHDEVSGYLYESNACLACHPTGEEE